jgi:hypothetical protein
MSVRIARHHVYGVVVVADLPWQSVEPVPELNGDVSALLATIEDLRRIWPASLSQCHPG